MDIEPEEVNDARDMLKDVIQAFAFPAYELGVHYGSGSSQTEVGGSPRDTVILPTVELSEAEKAFLADHCNALIDAQEAEDETQRPRCGDLCEINGFEYVVVQESIDGDLQLEPRGDADNEDDEDCFLCPPSKKVMH
jgi:hypothetical protein